jgi:hypothetical protein
LHVDRRLIPAIDLIQLDLAAIQFLFGVRVAVAYQTATAMTSESVSKWHNPPVYLL